MNMMKKVLLVASIAAISGAALADTEKCVITKVKNPDGHILVWGHGLVQQDRDEGTYSKVYVGGKRAHWYENIDDFDVDHNSKFFIKLDADNSDDTDLRLIEVYQYKRHRLIRSCDSDLQFLPHLSDAAPTVPPVTDLTGTTTPVTDGPADAP